MTIVALIRGAYDQDRAVGVADDRIRHAPHQGPPQPTQAAASHHDQTCADLLAHAYDLLIPVPSRSEMHLRDGPSGPLDLLYLALSGVFSIISVLSRIGFGPVKPLTYLGEKYVRVCK
jgi:hypothetical protein